MRKERFIALCLITMLMLTSLMLSACGSDMAASAGSINMQKSDEQVTQEDEQDAEKSDEGDFLADIPEWSGFAFCYVNGNKPDFAPEEIWTTTQESLDQLDELGRCGTANSCIGVDGMPTESRGDISEVHPSGWHTDRYDFVEGELLYNRCHLIAHQLSGDDAVPRNLITGTSYMNRDGMLPFEIAIGNYVRDTKNHVMYRVTPVFVGDELICRGIHMEAVSVEDEGKGLAFNVFCYNVQPGVDIDYRTGDNKLSEDTSMLEDYQAGKFILYANTLGFIPSADEENALSEQTTEPDNNVESDLKGEEAHKVSYVLNTNTKRFHYPDCRSVKDIKDKNRQDVEATREAVLDRGFTPCGNCKP